MEGMMEGGMKSVRGVKERREVAYRESDGWRILREGMDGRKDDD